MRMITAVVRPHALDDVRRVLERHAVLGMTVSEVQGAGHRSGPVERYRGVAVPVSLVPALRIETVLHDDLVDRVLADVEIALHTGRHGDGKLWVTPVDHILRVRTGERGADAV